MEALAIALSRLVGLFFRAVACVVIIIFGVILIRWGQAVCGG